MRIAIVSRGDSSSGGAGRIAESLATALKENGHEVCHLLRKIPRPGYSNACRVIPSLRGDILFRNLIGIDISGILLFAQPQIWDADILHFHDFSVAFGPLTIFFLSLQKPVIITLHDYSGLTGGCLYPNSCRRYNFGCGKCPQVGSPPLTLPFDLTKYHFRIHKKIATNKNVQAVAPSQYLKNQAKKSAWKNGKVHVIPNAFETHKYKFELRTEGRRRLKLETKHRALLFVASNVLDPRKGFVDLAQCFLKLAPKNHHLILVIVGQLSSMPSYLKPFLKQIRIMGTINDTSRMAEFYAACDCLILPTREDNFPCTILESLSFGTPVIAYDVGGIREMFKTPEQGYLVPPKDQEGLLDSILKILASDKPNRNNGVRRYYLKHHSTEDFLKRHILLYEESIRQIRNS